MPTKRYRVVPIAPDRFDIQVWVGWRWFGSWEEALEQNGKIATYETAELAERFITRKLEQEEYFELKRQVAKAAASLEAQFRITHPPYEFPRTNSQSERTAT